MKPLRHHCGSIYDVLIGAFDDTSLKVSLEILPKLNPRLKRDRGYVRALGYEQLHSNVTSASAKSEDIVAPPCFVKLVM